MQRIDFLKFHNIKVRDQYMHTLMVLAVVLAIFISLDGKLEGVIFGKESFCRTHLFAEVGLLVFYSPKCPLDRLLLASSAVGTKE